MNKWILALIYFLGTFLEVVFEGFNPTQFEQAMIVGIIFLLIREE